MAESRIRNENYFQVNGWMLTRLGLKGTALQLYAIIYGFSQDGESSFTGSLQYLSDFTNSSKPTVIKTLKELVDRGYVLKTENVLNGVKFNTYKANLQVVKNLYQGSKETLPGGSKETLPGGGKETLPNNKYIDTELNNKYLYIVEYLNEKAGTAFKSTSKATQKLIKARLDDGFSVEDFKTVIDNQCAKWKNNEWSQYLRPSTLFGNKFENYLNANGRKQADGQNAGDSSKSRIGNYI